MPSDKPRNRKSAADRDTRRRQLVDKALALLERRLDNEELNSSLADLVRLLEVARQMESESAEETVVRVEYVTPEWEKPENAEDEAA